MAVDGSAPPTVTVSIDTNPGFLTAQVAPDGQRVVYLDGTGNNTGIYSVPVTGGAPTNLEEGLPPGETYDFALSP